MANPISGIDDAGRKIAGLLTYNPGPGIYSRLERAIEQMPENVRVQELPGLLKRYKEGVPGWELKETDLDSVIAGRDAVSREELLARVKERSPVYTHKEIALNDDVGYPNTAGGQRRLAERFYRPGDIVRSGGGYDRVLEFLPSRENDYDWSVRVQAVSQDGADIPGERPRVHSTPPREHEVRNLLKPRPQEPFGPIGSGETHGNPLYGSYGQGGDSYTEMLLLQPNAQGKEFGSHWSDVAPSAVAHARFDTHGDALRINELQSDLGIHNRKARERGPGPNLPVPPGGEIQSFQAGELPFPLEDTWADLLIKRLALEAARKGHRAIEVASPRAIADKVGGNIDNYEHFYGKVVPGALERLGRKMGGLVEDVPGPQQAGTKSVWDESEDLLNQYRRFNQGDPERIDAFNDLLDAATPATQRDAAYRIYQMFDDGDPGYATAVTRDAIALADQTNAARAVRERLLRQGIGPPKPPPAAPSHRYLMSDEMRRRLIEQGVGASVLAPLLMQEDR